MSPEYVLKPAVDEVRRALEPVLGRISSISFLEEGFSRYVIRVNKIWVVRINKTQHVYAGSQVEADYCAQLTSQLTSQLTVQLPHPVILIGRQPVFPHGGSYYPFIEGSSPKSIDGYEPAIVEFLLTLHQSQLNDLPVFSPDTEKLKEVYERSSVNVDVDWSRVKDLLSFAQRVTIHGDFWPGNLLVSEEDLIGVLDFENLAVGDPAVDFAAMAYLGDEALDRLLKRYPGADSWKPRVICYWLLRELAGLHFAQQYPESGEYLDSVTKVRLAAETFSKS